MPPVPRTRRPTVDSQCYCPICHESVKLETAKCDEDGKAIHEACYLQKLSGLIPTKVKKAPARQD